MPRERDERTRRPPARKITTDGMDERSDNLGDTDRDKTDLRSGQRRFELGRNPHGAPISVNEAISRYKEAQARKFSEHITKPPEIPPPDPGNTDQRRTRDSGYPPTFTQPEDNRSQDASPAAETPTIQQIGEAPRFSSFSEARADYRINERSLAPTHDNTAKHNRNGSAARLRLKEQPEGLQEEKTPDGTPFSDAANSVRRSDQYAQPEQAVPGTSGRLRFTEDEAALPIETILPSDTGLGADPEQPDDLPAPEEQPETGNAITNDASPESDSAMSHERESLLSHERQGRLQYDRASPAPVKPPKRKPIVLSGAAYSLANGKQGDKDSADVPAKATANAEYCTDQRRDDNNAPSDTSTDMESGTTADSENTAAADIPLPETDTTAEEGVAGDEAAETGAYPIDANIEGDMDGYAASSAVDGGLTAPGTTGSSSGKASEKGQPTEPDKPTASHLEKKKSGKLNFSDEAKTPDRVKSGRKVEKAHNKAGRSSEKLQAAKEKLPTKRKFRTGGEFDAEKGKLKPRLRFEQEVKTQREHLKGPVATRPIKAGAGALVGYAHGKMYQIEEDNVGVKAAHRAETLTEGGVRTAYRRHKAAPYRKVEKLERKTTKLNAKASYEQALHDNPELKKKHLSRMWQKHKIKRDYAQAAREAQRTGKAAKKTATTVKEFTSKVVSAIKNNPKVFAILALILLVIVLLFGLISSCSNMASGIGSSVAAMSYVAEDADIDCAELYYTERETDLRLAVANAEASHAGYDEYRYDIGTVSHDPYMLMGFLSAVYQDFTFASIQPVLDSIFSEQYQLAFTPSVEIRYRTETVTDTWTDPETGESYSDSYDIEVPYEWHILTVTLTSQPMYNVLYPRMDDEQRQQYALLMRSKGLRQYVSNPFEINWLPYVSSYYGFRVHPITGLKDYHMGIDIALPIGTEILSGLNGTVTFAGVLSGYGNVVVVEDGAGLVAKYAHCDALLVSVGQAVATGDVVATVGNTGSSTGPHLHFEVIKDGQYLNPIYFAYSGDDGSSYIPPGSPGGYVIPDYPGEPMGDGDYAIMMAEAMKYIGYPYVWGGSSPESSFDCSGYVSWVLTQSGVKNTGRLGAQGLFNICTPVSPENAQPGDLIFFTGTYDAPLPVTHVGIYIENGQMLHCGNPIGYASINTSYWQSHFYAFGRIN